MSGFAKFIPGLGQVKLIGIGIAAAGVLAIAIWIGVLRHQVNNLREDNAILTTNNKVLQDNNDTLKGNLETAIKANEENVKTIESLKKERQAAVDSVVALTKKQKSNAATIGQLQAQLAEMRKDEENNGPLAPVLRETIRGIQNSAGETL